ETEQAAAGRRLVLDDDLDVRDRVAKLARQRVDDLLDGALEVEGRFFHASIVGPKRLRAALRAALSPCRDRPRRDRPSRRRGGGAVGSGRADPPSAAGPSGRRLSPSGASSAPPPTSPIPWPCRRACTAGQSTTPGEICSSTQTLRTRAVGWSGQPPFASVSNTRSQSRWLHAQRLRRRTRPAAFVRLITRPAPCTVE